MVRLAIFDHFLAPHTTFQAPDLPKPGTTDPFREVLIIFPNRQIALWNEQMPAANQNADEESELRNRIFRLIFFDIPSKKNLSLSPGARERLR